MTATEYKTRLEFGIHLETVKQLVVEHGHTYVSNNAPDDYKLWRDNLLQRGEDPDAF